MRSDAFQLGQEFAKHYPSSVADMIAYQRLHDNSLSDEAVNVSESTDAEHSQTADTNAQAGVSESGVHTGATPKGGTNLSERGSRNPSNVQNVRHKSSQASLGEKSSLGSSVKDSGGTATKSPREYRSYLSFSQWKNTFSGARSAVSWLEYLRLPTRGGGAAGGGAARSRADLTNEALDFMRGVMDECTHLGNFCTPVDTSLVIIVAAQHDAYVPRDTTLSLQQLWPGSELRYVDTGHVAAFLTKQHVFRCAPPR